MYGYQPQPGYPQPPQHRTNATPILVGCGILAGLALLVVACSAVVSMSADQQVPQVSQPSIQAPSRAPVAPLPSVRAEETAEKPADTRHTVYYEVGGTAQWARISFAKGSGISQTTAPLPWSKYFKQEQVITSIFAQNKGTSGKITCRILVDDETVDEQSSTGAYAVVTCTHTSF